MRILLAYDKKRIPVDIDDQNFVGSLVSRVDSYQPGKSPQELVEASRRVDEEVANQMKSLVGGIPGIAGIKIPGLF